MFVTGVPRPLSARRQRRHTSGTHWRRCLRDGVDVVDGGVGAVVDYLCVPVSRLECTGLAEYRSCRGRRSRRTC